jgi:hypothetical protein
MRATLDLIERTESQEYYQQLSETFKEVRKSNSFGALTDPNNATFKTQRTQVLFFLNHYELVAVGCRSRVLDETFYAQFMRSAVIRD